MQVLIIIPSSVWNSSPENRLSIKIFGDNRLCGNHACPRKQRIELVSAKLYFRSGFFGKSISLIKISINNLHTRKSWCTWKIKEAVPYAKTLRMAVLQKTARILIYFLFRQSNWPFPVLPTCTSLFFIHQGPQQKKTVLYEKSFEPELFSALQ